MYNSNISIQNLERIFHGQLSVKESTFRNSFREGMASMLFYIKIYCF